MKKQVNITPQQIEKWVAKHFEYKKKSEGRQLVINNPWDGDAGFHFWISLTRTGSKAANKSDYWVHDWRNSSYNSNFINFVKKYKNISYHDAISEICDGRVSLRSVLDEEEVEEERGPVEVITALPEGSVPIGDNKYKTVHDIAVRYLKGRGVGLEKAKQYKIHYTANSLVFPYFEYGNIVFWQERNLYEKRFNFPSEAKTGLKKTDFFYNFDNIEQPCEYVIIVESNFNCISVGDNCIASGGAILAGNQLEKLRIIEPGLIILAPDRDKAGYKSIINNYFLLNGFKVAYSVPPKSLSEVGKKDWNDYEVLYGPGSASRYILENTHRVDIGKLSQAV